MYIAIAARLSSASKRTLLHQPSESATATKKTVGGRAVTGALGTRSGRVIRQVNKQEAARQGKMGPPGFGEAGTGSSFLGLVPNLGKDGRVRPARDEAAVCFFEQKRASLLASIGDFFSVRFSSSVSRPLDKG